MLFSGKLYMRGKTITWNTAQKSRLQTKPKVIRFCSVRVPLVSSKLVADCDVCGVKYLGTRGGWIHVVMGQARAALRDCFNTGPAWSFYLDSILFLVFRSVKLSSLGHTISPLPLLNQTGKSSHTCVRSSCLPCQGKSKLFFLYFSLDYYCEQNWWIFSNN